MITKKDLMSYLNTFETHITFKRYFKGDTGPRRGFISYTYIDGFLLNNFMDHNWEIEELVNDINNGVEFELFNGQQLGTAILNHKLNNLVYKDTKLDKLNKI